MPHLARIWNRQPPQRGLVQPMTACLLEQFLFSKHHFDPHGLIVATRDNRPTAFVHAGFGPAEECQELDTSLGVTHRVMIDPDEEEGEGLPRELLARSEAYLVSRGAQVLYGGGIRPLDAFYLGLYGGSELPGVLDSDTAMQQLFTGAGYRIIDRVVVLHCDLSTFRAPVTWATRQWGRSTNLDLALGETSTWWQRSTAGCIEAQRFELRGRDHNLLASTTLWDLEPLATTWGVRAAGILDLRVAETMRRKGIATHFLSELLRQLRLQGVGLVEAQTMIHNEPALQMYRKLGFTERDRGAVFRKDSP